MLHKYRRHPAPMPAMMCHPGSPAPGAWIFVKFGIARRKFSIMCA